MQTRRKTLTLLSLAAATPWMARADSTLPKLALEDPIALALGYQEDANLVDTAKFPKRASPEGRTQFCDNCVLYAAQEAGFGTCTAIPGKLVAGKGWCNAWAKG